MGKIIQEKFPDLSADDKESVRQHAIAALNVTQQAKRVIVENSDGDNESKANTAFVTGVQKYVMDVRELDIDLIDSINPFSEAYSILAKTMSESSLRRVAAIISAKKTSFSKTRKTSLFVPINSKQRVARLQQQQLTPGKQNLLKGQKHSCVSRLMVDMTIDLDELAEGLSEFEDTRKAKSSSPRDDRIIAGFEEIVAFVSEHGRQPRNIEGNDIFERLYATRLNQIRKLEGASELLAHLDKHNLLSEEDTQHSTSSELDSDTLLAELRSTSLMMNHNSHHVRYGGENALPRRWQIAYLQHLTIGASL